MLTLGCDIGSSSIKVALFDAASGRLLASAYSPKQEMPINAPQGGWAEQDPAAWWDHLKTATAEALASSGRDGREIGAIGISYQMHGLVVVDRDMNVLRPSIIWCDSRATEIGRAAFDRLGRDRCLRTILNSPGNFTLSKLRWVRENEPGLFAKIDRFMLPGDYIAMRLTGRIATTVPGLSEGMAWDFSANAPAGFLLKEYGIPASLVAETVPTFGDQGRVAQAAAASLGLKAGTPVTYRAGDQPNNAFSLNVLQPGEVAATAGTSGVVYAVNGTLEADPQSRVNSFAHVTHEPQAPRIGVLLCINGCGIANSWTRRTLGLGAQPYEELNARAAAVAPGSGGIVVLPFGNGAERMFGDRDIGAQVIGASYTTHGEAHILRAVQEGVAFSFKYGMDLMTGLGITPSVIRAGDANLFRSRIFCDTLAGTAGVAIELYNTDGAQGAARGAALGAGFYRSPAEAFGGLARREVIEPDRKRTGELGDIYGRWHDTLALALSRKPA
ncbi:MAG TPA: FGGY family carbohydrate kinase [Bacteroidota bacterium]|nr:FGGY family carbohydrate kinase [Bacteroidota bacterium]